MIVNSACDIPESSQGPQCAGSCVASPQVGSSIASTSPRAIPTGDCAPGRFSKWAQETRPFCSRAARIARTTSQCGFDGPEYSSLPPGFG